MALYKYFKPINNNLSANNNLPDPHGPLSKVVPPASIESANKKVAELTHPEDQVQRGPYRKLMPEMKAKIAQRASEHGVAATIRYFANRGLPDMKEINVSTWKKTYNLEVRTRLRAGKKELTVKSLPGKKNGRPLILGEELDKQVRAYLTSLREQGAVINTAIVHSCAGGIVKTKDSNLLAYNGGHITLSKDWAKSLLRRMGFVKQRANTKAKVTVKNFEEVKSQFLLDIKDPTGTQFIPVWSQLMTRSKGISSNSTMASWTMEKEGSKRVEIAVVDDKRQITAVFAGSLTGDFLPPQLIYKGTTHRCLPSTKFPRDWHITCSENHWSNEEATMEDYVSKIILPYINGKREELKLGANYPALVIFDNFTGQTTKRILNMLEANSIYFVMVPAICTDRLQPMDVSVNKAATYATSFSSGMQIKSVSNYVAATRQLLLI